LDYTQIKNLNWKNHEGFVVRFSNGSRCKVKFQDYVDLHRQVTNLSTTGIWEALVNNKPVSSMLTDVPDEFYDNVHLMEGKFLLEYEYCELQHNAAFAVIIKYHLNDPRVVNRKEFAKFALRKIKGINPKILFYMLDGKDYSKIIWNMIKPEHRRI
jgi:RNA ligase